MLPGRRSDHDLGALLAEVARLDRELAEMTNQRDRALAALWRLLAEWHVSDGIILQSQIEEAIRAAEG